MRLTLVGIPRSRRGSRSASASLSLTPASSTYSNVTRRPCDSGKRRAASSSAAIGHRRFTGIRRSRTSSVVALSEIARLGAGISWPSFSMPRTMPTVDTVIRRGENAAPQGCCSSASARATPSKLCIGSPMPMNTRFVGRRPAMRGRAVDLLDDLARATGCA